MEPVVQKDGDEVDSERLLFPVVSLLIAAVLAVDLRRPLGLHVRSAP